MNPNPSSFHPSARGVIEDLRQRFPQASFLALGQTALWDEPTKAAVRRALDAVWPAAQLIAAAHDTDFFAKLPAHGHAAVAGGGSASSRYVLVGHDDARTRGLWSAAGEMSRLFGSEDVPTQHRLEQAGVRLAWAAARANAGPDEFLSRVTAAWGWSGIVQAERGGRKLIASDVPLADILPTLLRQLDETFAGSEACLQAAGDVKSPVAALVRGWVSDYAERHPQAALTDLYRDLYPRLYELLLGAPPANLSTSNTLHLLRLNRATASLPRFALVDRFLRPQTRARAIDAYNRAVAGSETYGLDRFGEGALPFDLVLPGRGRGTLHLREDGSLLVDLDRPLVLPRPAAGPVASIEDLASVLEDALGPDVALVGKAITLVPMLAAEFVLVFHEGASGYTDRSRRFVESLQAAGVGLSALCPILRVRYHCWDALEAVPGDVSFPLPVHLAEAFGRTTIPAGEFAACWHCAVAHARQRVTEISAVRSPRELLAYLKRSSARGPERWEGLAREHEAARLRLLGLWSRAQAVQGRVYTLYDQIKVLRREVSDLEKQKGDDFRARVRPLRERLWESGDGPDAESIRQRIDSLDAERARTFDSEIEQRVGQVRFALATVRDLKARRLALERGDEATEARATLLRIEAEAERAKAHLVANALRAEAGLPHTNFRPSAWWFPLVDPSGTWFRRLSETAEYYLEPLDGSAPAAAA